MKNLLLTLSLVLASCASVQPGNVPVAEGPVARTIERVLVRTEDYMTMPEPPLPIPEAAYGQVEAAIEVARAMVLMPEASGDMLAVTMAPIMGLHDALVQLDPALDELERAVYLEDTARLASLFDAVSIHAPVAAQ
jgi:hypothetical protein